MQKVNAEPISTYKKLEGADEIHEIYENLLKDNPKMARGYAYEVNPNAFPDLAQKLIVDPLRKN